MLDGSSKVLTINDPDSLNSDAVVTSVAISPDGQLVAAGSLDTVVRIWDIASGMLIERLRGHRDGVYSVAFTPDGKGLVSGSLDKTLKYWDVSGSVSSAKRKHATAKVKKEVESVGQCTMNFIGHTVC
jgi:glucose repression regulatory protein TUP1